MVAVGQDGLVANVAKYLDGQPVIGINPEPDRNPGVLVPHPARRPREPAGRRAARREPPHRAAHDGRSPRIDDGQVLRALNEIYVGHPTHQSARYRLTTAGGRGERQSSSGRARRHGHRRHRLVPVGLAWSAQLAVPLPGPDRARPVLVRPRGLAVAGHRHDLHRGPASAQAAR